ncbi:MAG TPA: alpha/beta hydrolase [Xanthobacteraceae bacterium]|nr:alpha/beta hydrolase [Xanthobacteraceae bacterium]
MTAAVHHAEQTDASGAAALDHGTSRFVTARDGLRLHVREYGPRTAPTLPVVCLPGFTGSVADFAVLAPALANGPPERRVIAIDLRGRGQSDYDSKAENYNLMVELDDVVSVLVALAVGPAVFLGSSRGGLLVMLLGAAHPTAIAAVVLHDVGPVIEPKGLARIKSSISKLPQPRSFEEGADILRRLMSAQFPKLTAEQWLAAARRTWRTKKGALTPNYDVRLARTLAGIDIERPLPPLWNEFDALARVPMLVVRGANSDLLSAATVTAMRKRRTRMEAIEIADQGQPPLLEGDELLARIARFVETCDLEKTVPGKKTQPD